MAIVPNKADATDAVDRPYCTPNRWIAATPNGTTTPLYVGEIVFDQTNKVRWYATSLANTDWRPMEAEVT